MQRAVLAGLLLLLVGNVFSALYDVSVKWLPEDANAGSFLLLRQLTSGLMLLPLWWLAGRPQTQHLPIHLWRASVGVVGALFLILGLMALPLATVSSLFYSAPLIIMLLGWWLLGERVSAGQWLCAILGFGGILLILAPTQIGWSGLMVLGAAVTFSVCQLLLRKLPATESPVVTILLYNLLGLPIALIFAAFNNFAGFSWALLGVALASNLFLMAYHWFCVLAYRRARAADIAIGEYSGLLFIVALGWWWFDEWPGEHVWWGAALVVLPSLISPLIAHLWQAISDVEVIR
ncbi:DMT family transporter [Shewanella amazonensis]|uniref:Integral membrane domain protein n=1 Tax=Shewanella amazonensis (strain ATCC BAA-1098 / SB2B) TaxID=326297 RepID=A1SB04_SHEAM|nr:DMT family transporter [Shewanella amazonensis]ABM01561.1 integral membrane domain protein [Shewanella amazonensis SB2B]